MTNGETGMKRELNPVTYIVASQRNGTIYTGVTSDLMQRIWQHRENVLPGFTRRHGVKLLVWFEQHGSMDSAITREKRIKAWKREWKLALIEEGNPEWRDLADDLGFEALGKK
jgi:putative endonuclease